MHISFVKLLQLVHNEHILDDQGQLLLVAHLVEELFQLALCLRYLLRGEQVGDLEDTDLVEFHQVLAFLVIIENTQDFGEHLCEILLVVVGLALNDYEGSVPELLVSRNIYDELCDIF